MSASRHYVHFISAGSLVVTLTAPAAGATVVSASPLITWTFTGGSGVQSAYRVAVYSDAAGTVNVYDSGYVASGVLSMNIPPGVLGTGVTLYIRVQVVDNNGAQGESALTNFVTAFATSVNVLGLAAKAVGTICTRSQDSLPTVRLTWTQVVPGAGEVFSKYQVKRRSGGSGSWTVLAEITVVGTLTWTDYAPAPWVPYQYAVTWTATTGASTLVSAEQTNTIVTMDFDFAWVHSTSDPTKAIRLDAWDFRTEVVDSVNFDSLWGRQRPAARIGDTAYQKVTISLHERPLLGVPVQPTASWNAKWQAILELQAHQRTAGAVLCFRHGRGQQRFFGALIAAAHSVSQKAGSPALQMVETDYTEAVA